MPSATRPRGLRVWMAPGRLFTADPAIIPVTPALFGDGLITPEGLRFSGQAGFPMYVAEEDSGDGTGRVSRIEPEGEPEVYCTGFQPVEDVVVDGAGRLYVSEDGSGYIIQITPPLRVWLPVVLRQP